jgi:hypothetical protein
MAIEADNLTRLNTLLNTALVHPSACITARRLPRAEKICRRTLKRPVDPACDWHAIAKRARLSQKPVERMIPLETEVAPVEAEGQNAQCGRTPSETPTEEEEDSTDSYKHHFGVDTPVLSPLALATLESQQWICEKLELKSFGKARRYTLKDVPSEVKDAKVRLSSAPGFSGIWRRRILNSFRSFPPCRRCAKNKVRRFLTCSMALTECEDSLPTELLDLLSTYRDLFSSNVQVDQHQSYRAATALHAMSHVLKWVGGVPVCAKS